MAKLHKHSRGAWSTFEGFLLNIQENLRPEILNEIEKFRTNLAIFNKGHILQLFLIINGSNEHEAISLFEEVCEFFSDAIFSGDHIIVALL